MLRTDHCVLRKTDYLSGRPTEFQLYIQMDAFTLLELLSDVHCRVRSLSVLRERHLSSVLRKRHLSSILRKRHLSVLRERHLSIWWAHRRDLRCSFEEFHRYRFAAVTIGSCRYECQEPCVLRSPLSNPEILWIGCSCCDPQNIGRCMLPRRRSYSYSLTLLSVLRFPLQVFKAAHRIARVDLVIWKITSHAMRRVPTPLPCSGFS